MATLADAAAIASDLPGVTTGERHGHRTWFVGQKAFAWERPFSKADIKRFGDTPPPDGPIFAVTVEDLAEKEAVLAAGTKGIFTIPHFNGYAAVLIHLKAIGKRALREAIVDGWLAVASPDVAEDYLAAPPAVNPAFSSAGGRVAEERRGDRVAAEGAPGVGCGPAQ